MARGRKRATNLDGLIVQPEQEIYAGSGRRAVSNLDDIEGEAGTGLVDPEQLALDQDPDTEFKTRHTPLDKIFR